MQKTSDLYKRLLRTRGHRKEIALQVAGQLYGEGRIIAMHSYGRLFRNNRMEVGGAVAKELRCTLLRPDNMPTAAELVPMYRLRYGDEVSEWIKKGVYRIYTRDPDAKEEVVSIVAFDAMVYGDGSWTPEDGMEFPMPMRDVAVIIAGLMGVELENPEMISDKYTIDDAPVIDLSRRNILQYIAAAHGGNFTITDQNKLRLCLLNDLPAPTHFLVDEYGGAITFGGVRILV